MSRRRGPRDEPGLFDLPLTGPGERAVRGEGGEAEGTGGPRELGDRDEETLGWAGSGDDEGEEGGEGVAWDDAPAGGAAEEDGPPLRPPARAAAPGRSTRSRASRSLPLPLFDDSDGEPPEGPSEPELDPFEPEPEPAGPSSPRRPGASRPGPAGPSVWDEGADESLGGGPAGRDGGRGARPRELAAQPAAPAPRAAAPAPPPDAPLADAAPASLGERLMAGLADLAVHLAVAIGLTFGARLLGVRVGLDQWPALLAFLLVFSFLYTLMPLAFWGKTPGMAWSGLEARGRQAPSMTFAEITWRWIGGLVTVALVGLPLLAALGGGRSLADRMSDSVTLSVPE